MLFITEIFLIFGCRTLVFVWVNISVHQGRAAGAVYVCMYAIKLKLFRFFYKAYRTEVSFRSWRTYDCGVKIFISIFII
jgi:hypothetical protein